MKKKHQFFHAKAILGIRYGGKNFFGQNLFEPEIHHLLKGKQSKIFKSMHQNLIEISQIFHPFNVHSDDQF